MSKVIMMMLALGLVACKNSEVQQAGSAYQMKGDTVYIHHNNALINKIKVADVTLAPYSKEVVTAGMVQPIPTQFAYIAPPFSGRVVKSHIRLGQKVGANTPLFEIISPDFTSAQKEYYQALSQKELAQKDLDRKKDLIKNGVGSMKEMEEALTALQVAEKEYENAYAALEVYRVDPRNMALGQALIIYSPISGEVLENNIVTGQYITADADPIAAVADLSAVWVVAQVKEKDIRFIHEDDDMVMNIAAYPGEAIEGQVYRVEEEVDEETRSIKVLSVCDNKDGRLKIGMYTTIHFFDKPSDIIQIPEKALLQGEKESYVFVETEPHIYVRTPVEVEASMNGVAYIAEGLEEGNRVISEGGYYIK